LTQKDKGAFIPIDIVPKKEWKTDEEGDYEQNQKDGLPVKVLVIGMADFFKHGPIALFGH